MMFNVALETGWGYHDMCAMPLPDFEMIHELVQEKWEREQQEIDNAKSS